VKLLLEKALPDKIYCLSEVHAGTSDGGNLRIDIAWKYVRGNTAYTFAVLELKRPGMIQANELRDDAFDAFDSDTDNKAEWDVSALFAAANLILMFEQRAKAKAVRTAGSQDGKTVLSKNPLMIVLQAGAYAAASDAHFVACFDWQSLVLFHFDNLTFSKSRIPGKKPTPDCGDTANFTVVNEVDGERRIRFMLAAFLVTAYRVKKKQNNH